MVGWPWEGRKGGSGLSQIMGLAFAEWVPACSAHALHTNVHMHIHVPHAQGLTYLYIHPPSLETHAFVFIYD